jgi:leucyl/phenylalanyl-tRNA--protein transferase
MYAELFLRGLAHSVECWEAGELVGGLYGVALGGAFFGESMFSTRRDASKVALVHLVARLAAGDFRLLDAQFMTEHLAQFGTEEVSRADYHARLREALTAPADFYKLPPGLTGAGVLQAISHTS